MIYIEYVIALNFSGSPYSLFRGLSLELNCWHAVEEKYYFCSVGSQTRFERGQIVFAYKFVFGYNTAFCGVSELIWAFRIGVSSPCFEGTWSFVKVSGSAVSCSDIRLKESIDAWRQAGSEKEEHTWCKMAGVGVIHRGLIFLAT